MTDRPDVAFAVSETVVSRISEYGSATGVVAVPSHRSYLSTIRSAIARHPIRVDSGLCLTAIRVGLGYNDGLIPRCLPIAIVSHRCPGTKHWCDQA